MQVIQRGQEPVETVSPGCWGVCMGVVSSYRMSSSGGGPPGA